MKRLHVFRYVMGGALLVTGFLLCLSYFAAGGRGTSLSTILLCIAAGGFLVSFGRRAVRNILGLVLLTMFFTAAPGAKDLGSGLMAMSLLILSAIFFSETLSQLAAKPLTAIIDNVYFGSNRYDPPPLTLRLARFYRRDLRFDEALDECERLLEYHPRSLELWCELLHSIRERGTAGELPRYLRRARRRLNFEDRHQLEFEFQRYLPAGRLDGC
jgi:hypothetical protein